MIHVRHRQNNRDTKCYAKVLLFYQTFIKWVNSMMWFMEGENIGFGLYLKHTQQLLNWYLKRNRENYRFRFIRFERTQKHTIKITFNRNFLIDVRDSSSLICSWFFFCVIVACEHLCRLAQAHASIIQVSNLIHPWSKWFKCDIKRIDLQLCSMTLTMRLHNNYNFDGSFWIPHWLQIWMSYESDVRISDGSW